MTRRLAAALAVLTVALPVAGCGGADVAYTEIKSDPPTLPIPQDQGTAASASADTSGTRDSAGVKKTKTGDASDDTSTSTGSTGTSSTGTTGTTTTPSTTVPAPAATTAPSTGTSGGTGGTTPSTPTTAPSTGSSGGTGGATSEQGIDQFCADNPGACSGN